MILRIFLISSLLVGCGTLDRLKHEVPPQIITEWRTYDCPNPPRVDPVKFRPVVWVIEGGSYTLSPDGYANLGENMADIISRSAQMREIILFYMKCIDAAKED